MSDPIEDRIGARPAAGGLRVLLVHNAYGKRSGEEVVVDSIRDLLRAKGHPVASFARSSAEIAAMRLGQARAFLYGFHRPAIGREFARVLERERPDIVQIQNVYPLLSPIVFPIARRAGVPVVFRCANYRLFCPTGLLLSRGEICERCVGGREYWCILRNCERSLPKSLGYALRSAYARMRGLITRNTTMYYAPSRFQVQKFIAWGIPPERIAVIPNFAEAPAAPAEPLGPGGYVGYAGRISPEKGVPVLLEAARACPDVPFQIAGGLDRMPGLPATAPPNVTFLGPLARAELAGFYAGARCIVVPSTCYETFGMVVLEAMLHARPVIGANLGSLPEIIHDRVTGLLFPPGNAVELADRIRQLWSRPELAQSMGRAGHERACREYTPDKYYDALMSLYRRAIELGPGARAGTRCVGDGASTWEPPVQGSQC